MKIVISSYWGRPKKLASRGIRTLDGRVESYLTAQLAVKTAIFTEALGALAFPAYSGSFRNNCYYANRIRSDLLLLYTFGTNEYTSFLYSEKCNTGKVIIEHVLLDADMDFVHLSGGLKSEELKRKEPRYGMISYLSPTIPGIIIVFPIERYFVIKKYIDLFASRLAIYFTRALFNMKILVLKDISEGVPDEQIERTT